MKKIGTIIITATVCIVILLGVWIIYKNSNYFDAIFQKEVGKINLRKQEYVDSIMRIVEHQDSIIIFTSKQLEIAQKQIDSLTISLDASLQLIKQKEKEVTNYISVIKMQDNMITKLQENK
jgi:peptidoglycan hydrolase CwlO-like protein